MKIHIYSVRFYLSIHQWNKKPYDIVYSQRVTHIYLFLNPGTDEGRVHQFGQRKLT